MAHEFPNLMIVDHPLVQHKLSHLRSKRTPTSHFRALLKEVSLLMGYEVTRHLELVRAVVETPIGEAQVPVLKGPKPAIVPILRAGLGMAEGLIELLPTAPIGHIGLYRDPDTKRPVEYYVRLPPASERLFIVVDPMLATGFSAVHAVDVLNRHGVPDSRIRFLAAVAAVDGMRAFNASHATVQIYTAALDEKLNKKAYIVPGLGDAGDRLFGTD